MRFTPYTPLLYVFLALGLLSCKSDDEAPQIEDFKAENRKPLGVSAEDLLSDDIYGTLKIELVFNEIYRPSNTAIAELQDFLEARLNKPGGISIVQTNVDLAEGAPFTIQEIRDIEDENRTIYTEGDTMAVYIFFANGSSSNDTQTTVTLGTAYQNTSIVIYEKTLRDLVFNNPTIDLATLESTTIQHELGHILGLVNLQNDDIHTDHEDPSNSKHCVVEECLMYFESNNGRAIVARFNQRNSVPALDPLCIADLQAKGGK
ncbi:membrane metalloprotease [Altibacter sp.]|uniref:membrane metalloprotease n=1 Tax=Altibacter sp. TaxID=2024823 RepID=UPI000C8A44FB|nr:membrane metalloprotease [Altibacter sp.]MAP54581.1 membrane metalloprotease [Altibacter sp.]